MKRIKLFILIIFSVCATSTIAMSLEDVTIIKDSELYVQLPKDKALSEDFVKAVQNIWTFTPIAGFVSSEEAVKIMKENSNACVMRFEDAVSSSLNQGGVRYFAVSTKLLIVRKNKTLGDTFVSSYKGNVLGKESLYQAVGKLNDFCTTIYTKNLKSDWKMLGEFKERGSGLLDKTLLLNKEWVSDKLSMEDIKKVYPGKVKLVSFEDFQKCIEEKNPEYAYVMVSVLSAGGKYRYMHMISDAETGKVYAMPNATVQSNNKSNRVIGVSNLKLYAKATEKQ